VGGAIGGRGSATAAGSGGKVDRLGVLLFTRTEGDRHDSIEAGVAALTALGQASNWIVQHLDEPDLISAKSLSSYEVLVLLNTSGDIFDDEQQSVLETYIPLGLGFVGIHGAADTEHDWPFYRELLGARVRSQPEIQEASLVVEDPAHATTAHLPSPWLRTDEWYAFDENPRPDVDVLLSIDESSYSRRLPHGRRSSHRLESRTRPRSCLLHGPGSHRRKLHRPSFHRAPPHRHRMGGPQALTLRQMPQGSPLVFPERSGTGVASVVESHGGST
jgi:hypothetical protein